MMTRAALRGVADPVSQRRNGYAPCIDKL